MRGTCFCLVLLAGCGAAPATVAGPDRPAPTGPAVDVSGLASPVVELRAPGSDEILTRVALLKSSTPTDPWDPTATVFARAFCIDDACFQMLDRGERPVAGARVTAVGETGTCEVEVVRAREVRAHLDADPSIERVAVDQTFFAIELGPCGASPTARADAAFGRPPVEVLPLRDARWEPASPEITASLDALEDRTLALFPGEHRVPILVAEVAECGITLAHGISVYWIHEGTVNQPFDAARFVRAGESLYAFSYIEGMDPLLERLDRVTCSP